MYEEILKQRNIILKLVISLRQCAYTVNVYSKVPFLKIETCSFTT